MCALCTWSRCLKNNEKLTKLQLLMKFMLILQVLVISKHSTQLPLILHTTKSLQRVNTEKLESKMV